MLRIRPFILAGGKSSRMGRDKAMLELEGKTLLARAVETLRSIKSLQPIDGQVRVTICGARDLLEGADRAILDGYPACGPLGGIEAALRDLTIRDDADWAFFIPVDMPLLSSNLIDHLLLSWTGLSLENKSLRAFFVEVEGIPQPLVSLVHKSLIGPVREALVSGCYKVVPILQSAGAYRTSFDQRPMSQGPIDDEYRFSNMVDQFINVNTETDVIKVATFLKQRGSNNQAQPPAR